MPPVRLLTARFGAAGATEKDLAWQESRIDVPADAGMLRLRVGALDFADGGNIRYRYKLEGFDSDWIDNGAVPEITYTRLPPGNYAFLAQATNRDGVWNPQMLRLPVHVAPPMWRHPLALVAYAIAALLLIGAIAWLVVQRRRREKVYFSQIRDREERLQLALWASGEMFWDYDLSRGEMRSMRTAEGNDVPAGIAVQTGVDQRHEIHVDDLPRVLERLQEHIRGQTPLFLSEHRIRGAERRMDLGARARPRGRTRRRRPRRCAWPAPRATSPPAARAERERRIAQRSAAQHERGGRR